jgi:hypothetical protein
MRAWHDGPNNLKNQNEVSIARLAGRSARSISAPFDRHPLASVGSLVLGLRCTWCPGSAPTPGIVGLRALAPVATARGAIPQ